MEDKLKQGDVCIVRGANFINKTIYMKLKIIEKTVTTYFIENLDAGEKFRIGKEEFYKNHEVLEFINEA